MTDDEWLLLITNANRSGDLRPLFDRLRRCASLSDATQKALDELTLDKKLRLQATPRSQRHSPFELTDEEMSLLAAALEYKERGPREGESRDDAITRLAKECECDRDRLEGFVLRKSGGGLDEHRRRLGLLPRLR